jgi:hypothetical protein
VREAESPSLRAMREEYEAVEERLLDRAEAV